MVGNGNILPDSEKAAKVANCLSDMHYKIMIPLEINIWLEDRLTSQIVLHDMQNNLHVYNSTLWIFFFNEVAYLNLKLPQRTIPLLHRDGSQQQFSTVKYSSTTPLNSTSSLAGTRVTLVTVMNTCKICQILIKRKISRSRWSEID